MSSSNGYAIVCKDGTSIEVPSGTYTLRNEVILTTHSSTPDYKCWILDEVSARMESSMTYTSDGRQIAKVTDGRGNSVNYTYDSNSRLLTKMTDAKGNVTNYTYDADTDHLKTVSKPVGSETATVTYGYENDRLTSIAHNGVTYGFTYDTFGNRKAVTVGGNELVRTEYRAHNGLVDRVVYATGESVRNVYNDREQLESQYLVKADDTEVKLFTNYYDSYGNLARHEDHRNAISSSYQYDMIGRSLGADFSDGMSVRTQYDDNNRVSGVVQNVNGQTQKTAFVYGEAANGQKPGIVYNVKVNGTTRVSYAYDALCRVSQKTLAVDGGTLKIGYKYLAGKTPDVTTALVESVTIGDNVASYTYDANGNVLTNSWNSALRATYHYDALNRLVREDNAEENKTICYTYDIGGNMLSWKEYAYTTGTIASDAEPAVTNTYVYGNTTWKDQLTSFNGMPITYDGMGNPLTYKYWTFGWEKGRQLVSIDDGYAPITFAYDTNGRRIRKAYLDNTTRYYWNGSQLAALQDGDTFVQFAYDENGKPIVMNVGGTAYYYLYNIQGDVTGLLDAGGSQVVSYKYNSWGRMLSMTDTTENQIGLMNPFRYRGYIQDDETGMYYVGSRYYDPEVGRFINADTTGILEMSPEDVIDKNLYVYCDGNPIMRMDAGGQIWMNIALHVGINLVALCVTSLITGEEITVGDLWGCVLGGFLSAFGLPTWMSAVIMGTYSAIACRLEGGTVEENLIAGASSAIGDAIGLDATSDAPVATKYIYEAGMSVVIEQYETVAEKKVISNKNTSTTVAISGKTVGSTINNIAANIIAKLKERKK